MNCSRDFALCVLFGMEFTPANVIKANSKLESYGDLEVCYDSSERNPILVPKNRINMILIHIKDIFQHLLQKPLKPRVIYY